HLEVFMTAVDPNNPTADLATVPTPAAGVILNATGIFAAPGNPDLLGILTPPPAVTNVPQNTEMILTVTLKGPPSAILVATAQWQRWDGSSIYTNIPGATALTYRQFV